MTRSRYKIGETDFPYFLTCTVVAWLPVFTRSETVQIVLDSWRFLQDHGRLTIFGYVILENHLHLIAAASDLTKEIGDFKSFTARTIIDHLEERRVHTLLEQLKEYKARHKTDRTYQLWQEGSHPKMVQNEEMMRQKLEYIHFNPVSAGTSMIRRIGAIPAPGTTLVRLGLLPVTTEW
jgi:hypothetical protein